MGDWRRLRPVKLALPAECQSPSCRFPEIPSRFEPSDASQFVIHALDGSDENRLAPIGALCGSGETLAALIGCSLSLPPSLPRQCTLPVAHIPKAPAKAVEGLALHLSNRGMVRLQYDFPLIEFQNAELGLAWN
jgi:hypothetical protein